MTRLEQIRAGDERADDKEYLLKHVDKMEQVFKLADQLHRGLSGPHFTEMRKQYEKARKALEKHW